jgi:RNA polymerase sigma factor for flagellar operon FliA
MAISSPQHQFASEEDRMAQRDTLVMEHLPQVRLIARQIHGRLPSHISLDDLVSTGVLGLISAIDNFDPSLNVQLKTYADRRIRGAILDSLREMDWAPRDTRKKAKLIESAIQKAKQRLGRDPSEEEIATELHVSPSQYQQWLSGIQAIDLERLECVSPDGEGSSMLRFVSDDEENWPSRIVERAELEGIVAAAVEKMAKLERTILNLYYYEELTLTEIAQVVGLHLSRVAQLRVQAVLRLRSQLQRVCSVDWRMKS